jgi:hypothetical protein
MKEILHNTKLTIVSLLLGVVVIGVAIVVFWPRAHSIIPAAIARQTNFVLFYPREEPDIKIQTSSIKYSTSIKQFSFIVNYQGRSITFAEQTTPEQFTDIPAYKDAFLTKLGSYETFENSIGRVDLTRPKETKNQVAVMISKGTLVFAQTNRDMTEDQWRELFNKIVFLQPS